MRQVPPACEGFSYIEVMVAVVLLALCAVPLADAIRNGMNASGLAEAKAQELRCMKNTMETVLAEPFDSLWAEAHGPVVATSYSKPAGDGCGERNVYIAKYEQRLNSAAQVFGDLSPAEDTLLLVTVSSAASGYTFTTLVDR